MQCFKEGGSVKNKMPAFLKKETKSEVKMDKAQDKSMVKKGVKQHESALHKGEPKTELKLKTGGRAKKAAGTVKKFEKASGEYGAKKTAADKKNIKGAKKFVPAFKDGGKACAPSAAKKVKKMQAGGSADVKDLQNLGYSSGEFKVQYNFFNDTISDADQQGLFLSTTMTINSFSHADFAPADNLVDAVLIITAIGMGADTLDKFSSPSKKKKEETIDDTEA